MPADARREACRFARDIFPDCLGMVWYGRGTTLTYIISLKIDYQAYMAWYGMGCVDGSTPMVWYGMVCIYGLNFEYNDRRNEII